MDLFPQERSQEQQQILQESPGLQSPNILQAPQTIREQESHLVVTPFPSEWNPIAQATANFDKSMNNELN